jgi:tripartite-type tricarboxylate transporter receptor subunit TctC
VFDIIGRPWADKVKTSLGTVFVDNQPGAGGSLAAQLVAHAQPDRYTILLGASSIHLAEMILREHPLLDPMKELTPVSMVAITCFAIAVNPGVPVQNLQELIAYVKANPGKMSYGSAGTGTLNHLSGELLKSLTGITDLPHVPYRGASDRRRHRRPDSDDHPRDDQSGARISSRRQASLARDHRSDAHCHCPEISTAVEAGVPGLVTQQVLGLFAPAGTPKPIVDDIDDANHAAMADSAYRQSLVDAAVIPVPDWTTKKFDEFMDAEIARWTPWSRQSACGSIEFISAPIAA